MDNPTSTKPKKPVLIKPSPDKYGMCPDIYVRGIAEDPTPFQSYGISIANTWDPYDVSMWAFRNGFCQTAGSALAQKMDGRHLLRTDALKLQRSGVQDAYEALNAEEEISRLMWAFDDNIPDTKALTVSLNRALHADEVPCCNASPLYMLSTDPWIDNSLKVIDKQATPREQWLWLGHNNQTPSRKRCLYD